MSDRLCLVDKIDRNIFIEDPFRLKTKILAKVQLELASVWLWRGKNIATASMVSINKILQHQEVSLHLKAKSS